MTIRIDAHAAFRDLKAASAGPKLAEAIVKTVSQADADLMTNGDLKAELAPPGGRIDSLEHCLTAAGYRFAPA